MTKEELTLELVQTTIEGKIKGFRKVTEQLGETMIPELKAKVTFTIKELEEVLDLIKRLKD